MTRRSELKSNPSSFDFFALMREIERSDKSKPRFGDSLVLMEELATIEQDPFMEFPKSNIAGYEENKGKPPRISAKFLGFFGPQGALPLSTTVDAHRWSSSRDPSFARFTNVFATRYLQLFFRTWADARPVVQLDRPEEDRFADYLGSMIGIGSQAFKRRDTIDDNNKINHAGVTGPTIKSPVRLQHLLCGVFGVDVKIEERVGLWLNFDPEDQMALAGNASPLGVNCFLGQRVYSINDKIRICIRAENLEQYRNFLPSGAYFDKLSDLIFHYIGYRFEFEIQLSLKATHARPVALGKSGELGWTSWMGAPSVDNDDGYLDDARFSPMEMRQRKEEML